MSIRLRIVLSKANGLGTRSGRVGRARRCYSRAFRRFGMRWTLTTPPERGQRAVRTPLPGDLWTAMDGTHRGRNARRTPLPHSSACMFAGCFPISSVQCEDFGPNTLACMGFDRRWVGWCAQHRSRRPWPPPLARRCFPRRFGGVHVRHALQSPFLAPYRLIHGLIALQSGVLDVWTRSTSCLPSMDPAPSLD